LTRLAQAELRISPVEPNRSGRRREPSTNCGPLHDPQRRHRLARLAELA